MSENVRGDSSNGYQMRRIASTCTRPLIGILVHIPKSKMLRGTPPTVKKTNWPFSMENMSCRWRGGGVPAYLPPLFRRTKQAMSVTRVRRATAHRVPMTQPWVEKLLCWLSTPEKRNSRDTEVKDRPNAADYLSMTIPSTSRLSKNRKTWWRGEDVLTL